MIFCLIFFKKLKTKELRVFFYFPILLAVFVSFSLLSIYVFKSREFYLINIKIYVLFEYLLLTYLFHSLIVNVLFKKLLLLLIIPFTIYSVYSFFAAPSSVFDNTPLIIEFLIFIIVIIYFFYEKMQTIVLYPIYQTIIFWIAVAMFIYFSGNFFFLIFMKSSKDPVFIKQMMNIYSFITISKNIILCLALFGNEVIESKEENLNIPPDVNLDEFSLTQYKNN